MKKTTTLIVLLFSLTYSYSQKTMCEKKDENEIIDENSINKCEISNSVKNKTASNFTKTTKRINSRFKRVKNKKGRITTIKKNNIKIEVKNTINNVTINNLTKNILFSVVEEIPMFSKCKKTIKKENISCFKREINNHFNKNIYPEIIANENIPKKVPIKITIGISGKIIDYKILTKNKTLNNELKRVILKLPNLIPGKEKGFPVNVIYSFPINLTLI